MSPLELDALQRQTARYTAAIGPGGEKTWLAGQLASHVPALLAEVEWLRKVVDHAERNNCGCLGYPIDIDNIELAGPCAPPEETTP